MKQTFVRSAAIVFAALAFSVPAAYAANSPAQAGQVVTVGTGDEVKLLKVLAVDSNTLHTARFEVVVQNIAYQKSVNIHIRQNNNTWVDVPLTFNRAAGPGKEVWAATFVPSAITNAPELNFAVKYTVAGNTYWDNNGGSDYHIGKNTGTSLFGVNVLNGDYQTSFDVTGTDLTGYVTVKNLAPVKQVQVRYTYDNWATVNIVPASFGGSNFWTLRGAINLGNPNQYGFEEWNWGANVGFVSPSAPKTVQYAISYTVNGQTYWDNNFGQNYTTIVY